MGSDQLTAPDIQTSLEDRLKVEDPPEIDGVLVGVKGLAQSRSRDYKDRKIKSALEDIKKMQNILHRDTLIMLFRVITIVGFSLWAALVVGKVILGFFNQDQKIISENFIEIVSRTVIVEIIALVGTFAACVWKEPKKLVENAS